MLSRRFCFAALVLLILATSPVWALQHDVLSGPLGDVDVYSQATLNGSIWTYEYWVVNRAGNVGDIHVFMIDNPNNTSYFNATNDRGFSNPWYPYNVILEWLNGTIPATGDTGYFTYQSMSAPDVVRVDAVAMNGGASAWGYTIGMGMPIPEPGSIMALGGMLFGSAFYLRRSRRR